MILFQNPFRFNMACNGELIKEYSSIDVTEVGILISVKEEQLAKVNSSKEVIDDGISNETCSNEMQSLKVFE